MAGRAPSEITGFLSKVARNGLLDLLREQGRRVRPKESADDGLDALPAEWNGRAGANVKVAASDSRVERREFVGALRQCVERLQPRSQLIWFLRVFCGMPSREIATHPEIGVRTAHVDVLLQRCRQAIRDCVRGKGHESHDMPPGAFVELWKTIRIGTDRVWGDEH